jgi:hypothetical protein
MPNSVVVALRYGVVSSPDRDFLQAKSLDAETADFSVRLSDGQLVLRPREKFASSDEARIAAADFIRAWEIDAGLLYGAAAPFRLVYAGAEIADASASSNPPTVSIEETFYLRDEVSSHLSHGRYPDPPPTSHVSPEAEAIWGRLERHLAGLEPLLSMSYFCLTVLRQVGGDDGASITYRIDKTVLREISRLSSTRGDVLTARKFTQQTRPLTTSESAWLLDAIKRVVRHLLHSAPDEWLKMPVLGMPDDVVP